MGQHVFLLPQHVQGEQSAVLLQVSDEMMDKGPFTNDVSREGEEGGYPNSDAVREVA